MRKGEGGYDNTERIQKAAVELRVKIEQQYVHDHEHHDEAPEVKDTGHADGGHEPQQRQMIRDGRVGGLGRVQQKADKEQHQLPDAHDAMDPGPLAQRHHSREAPQLPGTAPQQRAIEQHKGEEEAKLHDKARLANGLDRLGGHEGEEEDAVDHVGPAAVWQH